MTTISKLPPLTESQISSMNNAQAEINKEILKVLEDEQKPTQGEWIYSKYSHDFGIYSTSGAGYDIALVREYNDGREAEENVKLIIKAVNNYKIMVEALKNSARTMTLDTLQAVSTHKEIISVLRNIEEHL